MKGLTRNVLVLEEVGGRGDPCKEESYGRTHRDDGGVQERKE